MQLTNSRIVVTGDGSHTLLADEAGTEIYHSRHGALQESRYVFIRQGLDILRSRNPTPVRVRVLEVGFGTGLNALLSMLWAREHNIAITYIGLEPNLIEADILAQLNYPELLTVPEADYLALHAVGGFASDLFSLAVHNVNIQEWAGDGQEVDIVLFDAFSPRYQADVWADDVFLRLFSHLADEGMLVTYSAKGDVQRSLKAIGYTIEKLAGPPGKREMIRAWKRPSSPTKPTPA